MEIYTHYSVYLGLNTYLYSSQQQKTNEKNTVVSRMFILTERVGLINNIPKSHCQVCILPLHNYKSTLPQSDYALDQSPPWFYSIFHHKVCKNKQTKQFKDIFYFVFSKNKNKNAMHSAFIKEYTECLVYRLGLV